VIEKTFEVNPEGDANTTAVKIAVPDHLKLMNMVIELTGEGKQLFESYYASHLKVNILEAFGELKVYDQETDKPLSSVYVKVFARDNSGKETFYKDGYTDLGGRFDFVQTSGNKIGQVKRFAILVLSDKLGSIIKECNPPKDASKSSTTASTSQDSSSNFLAESKAERVINRISAWKSKHK
jgi:hypothetical protein